jgi:ankyrin repeat protein
MPLQLPGSDVIDCKAPLHAAMRRGHTSVVRILLQRGSNPFVRDPEGLTALQCAVDAGNFSCVCELLTFLDKLGQGAHICLDV